MFYSVFRKLRLDSVSYHLNDNAIYFFKFFISRKTGIKFIPLGSWTILPASFDRFQDGYLVPMYGRNKSRSLVYLFYIDRNGVNIFKTFQGIRHIHKVKVLDDIIIVTTGDILNESKIILMSIDGHIIETIENGQFTRTTDVHKVKNKLYWIMDSEYVDSKCITYDLESKSMDCISNVRQPSWHSVLKGNKIYFSTTIENRSFWKGNFLSIYSWDITTNNVSPIHIIKGPYFFTKYLPPISIYFRMKNQKIIARVRGRMIKDIELDESAEINNLDLDLLFCETKGIKDLLEMYQTNYEEFFLNVLKASNQDDRWFNYLLKRLI